MQILPDYSWQYYLFVCLFILFICFSLKSPDGKLIASGAIDGIINLFDLQTGRLLHTLEGTRYMLIYRTKRGEKVQ